MNFLRRLALQGGKKIIKENLDDSSRLDVVETYDIVQGADKSLARPGRKQANVSVRMA